MCLLFDDLKQGLEQTLDYEKGTEKFVIKGYRTNIRFVLYFFCVKCYNYGQNNR